MNLKESLLKNDYSIVASNGYFSFETGIRPILLAMKDDISFFEGTSVADKIIGKASAMLLTLSGVKEVYTPVLSKAGRQIFEKYGVKYAYDELAEYIINRKGDGMCPMEMTVKDINDLNEAYESLRRKLAL
jgi:iron complex outermembrane receptor protein